jgi:hypothetical protein
MYTLIRICLVALAFGSTVKAAVTIQGFQNTGASQGGFLTSTGAALTSGGISIGYFAADTAPDLAIIQALNPSTAYSTLVSTYNYIDVRSTLGAVQGNNSGATGGFDWSFADGVLAGNSFNISGIVTVNASTGPTSAASTTNLPTGTKLYLLGFNAGTFVNGFAGSTEWAFLAETSAISGSVPADLGNVNVRPGSVAGTEIWVGTDNGSNVNFAAASVIPEPSRALLGMIGLGALFIRRRR